MVRELYLLGMLNFVANALAEHHLLLVPFFQTLPALPA